MKLYLTNKIALKFTGNVDHFFNGMTSNTVDALHNAFLNQHGRIVATVEQVKQDEDTMIVLMERIAYDSFRDHINKYLMLNKTTCEVLEDNVYCDLTGDALINGIIVGEGHGRFIISKDRQEAHVSDDEFTLFRLTHHMPLHTIDYTDQMILNISDKFVSFTKGCFLGQEPVSKVHNRSHATWKLIVKYKDECTLEEQEKMTSVILDQEISREKGFIFTKSEKGASESPAP